MTGDRDFGELVVRDALGHAGVILLRLRSRQLDHLQSRMLAVLEGHGDRLNEFLTVTDTSVRPNRSGARRL